MRIAIFDGTAVPGAGAIPPGRLAQFSASTIAYARAAGHEVEVVNGFDPAIARRADLVCTEWCNETAFAAAASGACSRLLVRIVGYDIWLPLDRLEWKNVHQIVYEGPIAKALAERRFPFLRDVPSAAIMRGIDLSRFPWKDRGTRKVFAMMARADYRKGHNLAIEWARRHPDYEIHTTLALPQQNPRLVEYLRYAAPPNFHVHSTVPDIAAWVDEIGASYLLSTAFWEDLGYTIAEGMALGLRPLVYNFPDADRIWPAEHIWSDLAELDLLVDSPFDARAGRAFVEDMFDGAAQSRKFFEFVGDVVAVSRPRPPGRRVSFSDFITAMQRKIGEDFAGAEKLVMDFYKARVPGSAEIRAFASMVLAGAALHNNPDDAQTWAFQALSDGPRADAFCLLGELAWQQNRLDAALTWYDAACAVSMPDAYTPLQELTDYMIVRRRDLRRISCGTDMTLLRQFTQFVADGSPFSFVKFGDGELQCMAGFEGANSDQQAYGDELGKRLIEAFVGLAGNANAYIADWIGPYRDMRDAIVEKYDLVPNYAPYHLILIGRDNLRPELRAFWAAVANSPRPKVFVGPEELAGAAAMLRAKHVRVPIKDSFGAIDAWLGEAEALATSDVIFVFAAGMPAKIAAHEILQAWPDATCIDAGSAFDPLFKDGRTRSGQPGAAVARHYFSELLEP